MNTMARSRITAYALDAAGYAAVAVCTVPLGLAARQMGWGKSRSSLLWLSTTPVAIAVALATVAESQGATWGKQVFGLRVERVDGGQLSVGQALLRNVVKVAIPWQLGHVTAVSGAYGGFERPDPRVVAAAVATYSMVTAGLVGVLSNSGVTFYDLLSRSHVVPSLDVSGDLRPPGMSGDSVICLTLHG